MIYLINLLLVLFNFYIDFTVKIAKIKAYFVINNIHKYKLYT